MTVSLEGRVALRELMAQAWQQVEGQAREMLKRAVAPDRCMFITRVHV
jgi:hypothetical protein